MIERRSKWRNLPREWSWIAPQSALEWGVTALVSIEVAAVAYLLLALPM